MRIPFKSLLMLALLALLAAFVWQNEKIGRASCRERV